MSKHLTPWYPPHIKPVRVGVYNANTYKNKDLFRYWNGKCWSICWDEPASNKQKKEYSEIKTSTDGIHWRGLSAAPTPEGK